MQKAPDNRACPNVGNTKLREERGLSNFSSPDESMTRSPCNLTHVNILNYLMLLNVKQEFP